MITTLRTHFHDQKHEPFLWDSWRWCGYGMQRVVWCVYKMNINYIEIEVLSKRSCLL